MYDEIQSGKLLPILKDTPIFSDNQEILIVLLTPQTAHRSTNVQIVMDFFVEKWNQGECWQV